MGLDINLHSRLFNFTILRSNLSLLATLHGILLQIFYFFHSTGIMLQCNGSIKDWQVPYSSKSFSIFFVRSIYTENVKRKNEGEENPFLFGSFDHQRERNLLIKVLYPYHTIGTYLQPSNDHKSKSWTFWITFQHVSKLSLLSVHLFQNTFSQQKYYQKVSFLLKEKKIAICLKKQEKHWLSVSFEHCDKVLLRSRNSSRSAGNAKECWRPF